MILGTQFIDTAAERYIFFLDGNLNVDRGFDVAKLKLLFLFQLRDGESLFVNRFAGLHRRT